MRNIISAALVFSVPSGNLQSANAQELRTLRYGLGLDGGGTGGAADQAGLGALPYIVGQRKGFFEQEGVRFEVVRPAARPNTGNSGYPVRRARQRRDRHERSQLTFLIREVLRGADFAAVAGQYGQLSS